MTRRRWQADLGHVRATQTVLVPMMSEGKLISLRLDLR